MAASKYKERGDLLEDIVASLHEFPGILVRKRVRLPVPSSTRGRKREVDVLLSQEIAGYPVSIAIECKNEKHVVGISRIDEFVGKLKDLGIPTCHGVFVSPTGYTKGALEWARQVGIRTLALEGLTSDRLGLAVNEALQSLAYLVASVNQYDRFEYIEDANPTAGHPWERLSSELGQGLAAINTFIWELWLTGRLPASLGSHAVFVRLPPGFRFSSQEPPFEDGIVIVTVGVTAHVARIPGTARLVTLRDAATSALEKLRVEADFAAPQGQLELEALEGEESLRALHDSLQARNVLMGRIRVPRIVAGSVFWPPSAEALARVLELRERGEEISLASVEGTDLGRAWEAWAFAQKPPSKSEKGA